MTLNEALCALERIYRIDDRACLETMPYQVKPLLADLGESDLGDLDDEKILDYTERRLARGVARSTVNMELSYLHRAFKLAAERDPLRVPKIRMLRLQNARLGFLLPEEFRRLVATLDVLDPVVSDMIRLLYLLGWRSSEVRELRWEEIQEDLLTLPAHRSKNGAVRAVRLTGELLDVIRRRRAAQKGPCVFHRDGRPVKTYRRTWKRAVEAIGRPELVPHDLRRSFARNALQAGVPQAVIMEIAGWKTTAMFRRYAIVDESQLADALERVEHYACATPSPAVWAPGARSG